jgi:hypothetical protein
MKQRLCCNIRPAQIDVRRGKDESEIIHKGVSNLVWFKMYHIMLILDGKNGVSLPSLKNSLLKEPSVSIPTFSPSFLGPLLIVLIKFGKIVLIPDCKGVL